MTSVQMKKFSILLAFMLLGLSDFLVAQDPLRFEKEVETLQQTSVKGAGDLVLFTGSSSIRKWTDIQTRFPQHNIVNMGFGGSHMSDLLYYCKPLIIDLKPIKIFIYEGDNDIASGKSPEEVMEDAQELLKRIRTELPHVEIFLISVKPSPKRWRLNEQYGKLNELYKKYASQTAGVEFVNVWDIMLNEKGEPIPDIFVSDNLHLNDKGYDLWTHEIMKYLN